MWSAFVHFVLQIVMVPGLSQMVGLENIQLCISLLKIHKHLHLLMELIFTLEK